MRIKLWYLLSILCFFYLGVIYNGRAFLILGGTALFLPLFFLPLLMWIKPKLTFYLKIPEYALMQKDMNSIALTAENGSPFYLSQIKARIILKNQAIAQKHVYKVHGSVSAGAEKSFCAEIKNLEFGQWNVICREVRCCDWFGFLHIKKRIDQERELMVLPACYEIHIKVGIRTKLFFSDGEIYDPHISGDDPAEILKLRAYQKGDRQNRIHWKLSAKNDELIIKELSMPMGCNVVFFLNAKTDEMASKDRRCYWQIVHTIAFGLLSQGCGFYLVWQEQKERQLMRQAVMKEEELYVFWGRILQYHMGSCQFEQEYATQFRGDSYASQITLNQNLELHCNRQKVAGIHPDKIEKQLLEMELIL